MNIIFVLAAAIILAFGVLSTRNTSEEQEVLETSQDNNNYDNNGIASSDWIYPNSSVLSQGEKLILVSTDDAGTITDWYGAKINSEGYNTRNSIKASANDNIKNVISAARADGSVDVEITKNPSDNFARIELNLEVVTP
jgi:hypothetical protein